MAEVQGLAASLIGNLGTNTTKSQGNDVATYLGVYRQMLIYILVKKEFSHRWSVLCLATAPS